MTTIPSSRLPMIKRRSLQTGLCRVSICEIGSSVSVNVVLKGIRGVVSVSSPVPSTVVKQVGLTTTWYCLVFQAANLDGPVVSGAEIAHA